VPRDPAKERRSISRDHNRWRRRPKADRPHSPDRPGFGEGLSPIPSRSSARPSRVRDRRRAGARRLPPRPACPDVRRSASQLHPALHDHVPTTRIAGLTAQPPRNAAWRGRRRPPPGSPPRAEQHDSVPTRSLVDQSSHVAAGWHPYLRYWNRTTAVTDPAQAAHAHIAHESIVARRVATHPLLRLAPEAGLTVGAPSPLYWKLRPGLETTTGNQRPY